MKAKETCKKPVFKAGMSFRAIVPFSAPDTIKVHILYVLPSIYKGRKLIIYGVFGKHKQWWHELMCTAEEMERYKENAEPRMPEHIVTPDMQALIDRMEAAIEAGALQNSDTPYI